jgi:hypothetical protein
LRSGHGEVGANRGIPGVERRRLLEHPHRLAIGGHRLVPARQGFERLPEVPLRKRIERVAGDGLAEPADGLLVLAELRQRARF